MAPLLILVDSTDVRVLSTVAAPRKDFQQLTRNSVVRTLSLVADALELADLPDAIVSGAFFQVHRERFDHTDRVDRYLVRNLLAAGSRLVAAGGIDLRQAHLLLAQVIFACYLEDREVIGPDWFAALEIPGVRELRHVFEHQGDACSALQAVLGQLHRDFNGDVFGAETAEHLGLGHLVVLSELLRGDSLDTQQLSLGFWPYDFRVIPIETLSVVYEEFLAAEDPGSQRESGAYYTPRHVAELLLDVGTSTAVSTEHRYLDPACGSGVFLVALFHRLAESWSRANPHATAMERAVALRQVLTRCLFGVDQSETACRITALGLYLAWLDALDPRDIQQLQCSGAMLPRLLMRPGEAGGNIFPGEFFEARELPNDFDVVIGNPPWGTAAKGGPAERWWLGEGLEVPRRQIACAFILKAVRHIRPSGRVSLVLPAGILLNHQGPALKFARAWMSAVTIERVVHLADFCFLLFENADRPASIVCFRPVEPPTGHRVEVISPQVTAEALCADRVVIGSDDVRRVSMATVLPVEGDKGLEPQRAWKVSMRATGRDRRLLDRLHGYPSLAAFIAGRKGWLWGEGFNPGGKGRRLDQSILSELPHRLPGQLQAHLVEALDPAAMPPTTAPAFMCRAELFAAPHVLLPHGAPRRNDRIRAGFCSVACTFTHTTRAICGPKHDSDLLRLLACVLASPLARYLLFHTSANFGVERAKIHLDEYGRFPFPAPDTEGREGVFRQIADAHRRLEELLRHPMVHPDVALARTSIDELVYKYFDIDAQERVLVEDACTVLIPSATPTRGTDQIPALDVPSEGQRRSYCEVLATTLTGWASDKWRFDARSFASLQAGLGLVILERVDRTAPATTNGMESAELRVILNRLRRLTTTVGKATQVERGLKIFDDGHLYMVKPLRRRSWLPSLALADADEVAGAILGAQERT
ncbi:SAM-dependent methyltransferase [Myxococcota bacterium]|nr:SAM-dependent methyltransferase [Myxococcota bacterium]